MKKKVLTPQNIWEEYLKGEEYHLQTGLHDIVRRNEQFYNGEQGEGVNAPDLEKPVINIFKRAVTYLGSQIISSDVGISVESFGKENAEICRILTEQIERVVENTKAKNLLSPSIVRWAIGKEPTPSFTSLVALLPYRGENFFANPRPE